MLQKSNTDGMVKNCLAFMRNDKEAGRVGEEFLQKIAAQHNGADSAAAASVLADVYFLDPELEASSSSRIYNRIAAVAYQEYGQIELACHYYNQYLARSRTLAEYETDDVIEAVSFLLANNKLICTDRLLTILQRLIDATPSDAKQASYLHRLQGRAENHTIYLELNKLDARRNLDEAINRFQSGVMFTETNQNEIEPPAVKRSAAVSA